MTVDAATVTVPGFDLELSPVAAGRLLRRLIEQVADLERELDRLESEPGSAAIGVR